MSRPVLVVGVPGPLTHEHANAIRDGLASRGIDAVIVPAAALAVVEVPEVVEGST